MLFSHRWGANEDEVTFKELRNGQGKSKTGYTKIKACGEQARKNYIDDFWIDTCCIDKRSSAELSQAVNSMYRWYQNAEVCYGYLADVPDDKEWLSAFRESDWFNRGWTLQELIAPNELEFFDKNWRYLGDRYDLTEEVKGITGIPTSVLHTFLLPSHYCIVARMS